MGRILRFRRRGHIPEFEEALARLTEELTLTQSYADIMIRTGQYKAAAAVVDEQRVRLAAAQESMLAALRPRRRSHAAIAGLAAVMLVGSASFAALSSRAPAADASSPPVVLERVEAQLEEAAGETDETRANTIVAEALADLISIGPEMSQDPEIQRQVESMLRKQLDRLTQRPSTQSLISQIQEAVKKVKAEIKDPSPKPPAPQPKPESEPAPPAP